MSASAAASARSAVARSSSRKLVTLGCGSQPTSASAAASRGRSASTRSTFASHLVGSSQRGRDRRRGDGPDRARRPVDREPARSSRAAPTANPTRSPAIEYALEAVRTETTFGYRVRSGITECPDELAVGLVHDDRGRRAPVGRGVVLDALERAPRSRRRARGGRWGCSGCRPRRASRSRAAARTAGTSIAQPSAFERRGTAMTSPPRCSAWTRYIGVGRDRDDRRLARGQERLRAHVEDLVRAGAGHDLVERDPVAGRGGLDEPAVVAGRVLREASSRTGWPRAGRGASRAARATC